MADLKERNIVLVSKDSEGVSTLDYPLTIPEQIEGLEEVIKKFATLGTTLAAYGITDAKIENGVITLGDKTITPITSHPSLANCAKLNTANSFTGVQTIPYARVKQEDMPYQWNTPTPTNHCGYMSVSANTTINLTNIYNALPAANYMAVYTCFISSSGSYSLSITGASNIRYIGSAADCAIKRPGVLLNVLCWRSGSGGTSKDACVSVSACG